MNQRQNRDIDNYVFIPIKSRPKYRCTINKLTFCSNFSGYTTLHDRNDNNSPPSSSTAQQQLSYQQMSTLRNSSSNSGANASSNSLYPVMKEENNSNGANTNYPSLNDLSVRFSSFFSSLKSIIPIITELRHHSSSS